MIVQLTPSWRLTDEHAASSYGQPVLVQTSNPEAYGPGDMVRCYPGWPFQPASIAVERLANLEQHTDEEQTFIRQFTE
jgi:hypothetical protein